jgi:hypothetical protein
MVGREAYSILSSILCPVIPAERGLQAAMHKDDEFEEMRKNQAEIFMLLRGGARVDPTLLQLREEDLLK